MFVSYYSVLASCVNGAFTRMDTKGYNQYNGKGESRQQQNKQNKQTGIDQR